MEESAEEQTQDLFFDHTDQGQISNLAASHEPDDTHPVLSNSSFDNMKLKLAAIRFSQESKYERLLNEFSAIGSLREQTMKWKKVVFADKVRDRLELALWETELLQYLTTYLAQAECEIERLDMQQMRLMDENRFLREQKQRLKSRLENARERLRESKAERDKQCLIYRLRRNDEQPKINRPNVLNFHLSEDDPLSELMSAKLRPTYIRVLSYLDEGRTDVALAICTELAADRNQGERLKTTESAVFKFLLGIILYQTGQVSEAIRSTTEALESLEVVVGSENPCLGCPMTLLAQCMIETENYTEAESQLRRAISIKQNSMESNHTEVFKLRIDLCTVLLCLGRNDEAIQLSQTVLSDLLSIYPPTDPMVVKTKIHIIRARLELCEFEHAYKEVIELLRESFSKSDGEPTMVDLLEQSEPVTQAQLCSAYESLEEEPHGMEVIKLLGEVYKAKGKQDSFDKLAYFFDGCE